MNSPISQGWQCPCCKTVYAPSVMKCECKKVVAAQPKPPLPHKDLMDEYKKLVERNSKAKPIQRPFYPPPPPMELAPSWPIARPMCGTGESVPDLGHSTIP